MTICQIWICLAQGEECKHKCIQHHNGLQEDDGFSFIHVFDQYAARDGKKKSGQGHCKADQPQVKGTPAEAIRQQGQGCVLHRCADQRKQMSHPEDGEIA